MIKDINSVNNARPPCGNFRLRWGAILVYLAAYASAHAADYIEPGRAGDPASWRTPEFNAEWGLGAINADRAYAAGYSGTGSAYSISRFTRSIPNSPATIKSLIW